MYIKVDDLSGPEICGLLQEHLASMHLHSPPESIHALPIELLRAPEITFWTAWEQEELLGCGALKELDAAHAEIKSMRTAAPHLRKGVAKTLLRHIIAEASRAGIKGSAWRQDRWPHSHPHANSTPAQDSATAHRLPTTPKTQTACS